MKARKLIKDLLLVFVLVSIGYIIGKEVTLRTANRMATSSTSMSTGDRKVIVTYFHATIRCVTCNKIEKMAREILHRDFASELADGRIEWKTANYQEDDALARRYNVASSTIVVVRTTDGQESQFRKLDEVWEMTDQPEKFNALVGGTIRASLNGGTR